MQEGPVGGHLGRQRQHPRWGWAGDKPVPDKEGLLDGRCASVSSGSSLYFTPLFAAS